MYARPKSRINNNILISGYFPSIIDIRQGFELSLLLFSLFINDFKQDVGNTHHASKIADSCYPSLNGNSALRIKLFVMLYANNTSVLIEYEHQLQTLVTIHEYSLSVNIIQQQLFFQE